mgnify:CR=1 FL=1|tara:strand:+ start:4223 stop:4393 length:171 start_codon:yes stop_codon:yes gene_type:complete
MIIVIIIVSILLLLVVGGIYLTFGSGNKQLRDPIDEHARLHELGIAHGHSPKKRND